MKLPKIIAITGISFFVFLIAFIILFPTYIDYKKDSLKEKTYAYLLEEKGYKEEDIKSLVVVPAKGSMFNAEVIFEDEPEVIYYYIERKGKIIQNGFHSPSYDDIVKYKE